MTSGEAEALRQFVDRRPRECSFHVEGVPVTQGSMVGIARPDGSVVVLHGSREQLRGWREHVGVLARQAFGAGEPWTGPVAVYAVFWMPRARSRRHDYPIGDLDKLTRAVLDALTGIVFRDDVQVITLNVAKRYAESDESSGPPGLDITVAVVDALGDPLAE